MRRKFMFVGGLPSELIGLVKFRSFGQVEELDEEVAKDAARGGCAILPADDAAATAFTTAELDRHASFGSHRKAPAEFVARVRTARIAAAAFAAAAEEEHRASVTAQEVARG